MTSFWESFKKAFILSLLISLTVCAPSCKKRSAEAPLSTVEAADASGEETMSGVETAIVEEAFDNQPAAGGEEALVTSSDIDEIIGFEDEERRIASAIEELEEAGEEAVEPEDQEKLSTDFTEKNALLSFSEFDNEVIQPETVDGKRVMIYSIANRTNRRFYDEMYRLEKSEFWEIAGPSDSKIVKLEIYKYRGDEKRPFNKIVEEEKDGKSFFYRTDNLVEKVESFKKVDGKPYVTEIKRWKYDGENRVTEITTRVFTYNSEEDTKRRNVFVKLLKYKYNPKNEAGEEIPADVTYYENGVVKSEEKYFQKAGSYTFQYFFDGGISVKTWYVDYKPEREVIYQNNNVFRVRKFDEEKPVF